MADQPDPKEEEASLDRLLTRLALTEEEKLEKVLSKLLPLVIARLESPHETSRKKIMEILTHVNKRVKGQHQIALPLVPLLDMFCDANASPISRNFAMVYAEMAFERASAEDKLACVPKLLLGIAKQRPQHQDMLLRMAVMAVAAYGNERGVRDEEFAPKHPFTGNAEDVTIVVNFFQQMLLYMPPGVKDGVQIFPPGMSLVQAGRVAGKHPLTGEDLATHKLGLLNFVAALNLDITQVYPLYVVASVDSNARVAQKGEWLLKKKGGDVNLEDATLVKRLFALYQGSPPQSTPLPEERVSPGSPLLKARLMGTFTRSIVAANCFPSTLQVVFDCVYGAGHPIRLQQLGMEFAGWIAKWATTEQLRVMGPIIMERLLKLLDDGDPRNPDLGIRQVRSFTYQALGQLAQRSPTLFRSTTQAAVRVFTALREEDQSMRTTLQEAAAMMAAAYKGAPKAVLDQIEPLLLVAAKETTDQSRFCAVQWAVALFPSDHAPSRYVCMLGAGDNKLEIRELADKGLSGSAPPPPSTTASPPSTEPEQPTPSILHPPPPPASPPSPP